MSIRPQAILNTTIPDDRVEDEDDIVVYPGRTITETLVLQLRARGYRPTPPEHIGFLGWAFGVPSKRNMIFVRVSVVDEVYVSADYRPNFYDRALGRKDELYRPLLSDLDSILQADERFSNIRWVASGTYEPEFAHPVDGSD